MIISRHPYPGWMDDFDVVVRAGRPIVVTTDSYTWDPTTDQWTKYELDDEVELTSIGAAVVDGRVVVAGGGDHQGFVQWDLESGRILAPEQPEHGMVGNVSRVVFEGRELFVVGGTGPSAHLWRPGESDPVVGLWDEIDVCGRLGAGVLGNRRVLFSDVLWDIDGQCPLELDSPDIDDDIENDLPDYYGIASTPDHVRLVAAGERTLVARDPEADSWDEPLVVPGDGITCLDVANVDGVPIAVTGTWGGVVSAWDLANRRQLPDPFTTHTNQVTAVRVAELDGRPAVYSTDSKGGVRVQAFPRA